VSVHFITPASPSKVKAETLRPDASSIKVLRRHSLACSEGMIFNLSFVGSWQHTQKPRCPGQYAEAGAPMAEGRAARSVNGPGSCSRKLRPKDLKCLSPGC
jgi:hypothetical protein